MKLSLTEQMKSAHLISFVRHFGDEEVDIKNVLINGTFGETKSSGYFVVVGTRLIYQEGGFDHLNSFDDDLICRSGSVPNEVIDQIERIFARGGVSCFNACKHAEGWKILWER